MDIQTILDGTPSGQLKVRVFSFLNRLDVSRNAEPEILRQSVTSVFQSILASEVVDEWISKRSNY